MLMAKKSKKTKKVEEVKGCLCFRGKGFPTFATLLLVVGVLWLLGELGVFKAEIPWWPVVLIVVAVGWIVDHFLKK